MSVPAKEVIYVDTEDDITSVIEKVKLTKASIVALVPPKRTGMLQSIVNLKLVRRAAESANKRLVIITGDSALAALAAGVTIPVAKNLQTKPEIAEIAALSVDDEEVIDGSTLPISSKTGLGSSEAAQESYPAAAAIASTTEAPVATDKSTKISSRKKDPKASKIPDFNSFKKRILLIGGGILALSGFLVWAIWFAPQATVTIAAKTTPYNVSQQSVARPGADLDVESAVLPAHVANKKQTKSVEFTATGKKEVGKKASGTVNYTKSTPGSATISAGTKLSTEGGLVFVTSTDVTVPGAELGWDCPSRLCPGEASGGVTAENRGTNYNSADGTMSGGPRGVAAALDGPTSGGTDKTVTVVSDADVVKAREELAGVDEEELKTELQKEFDGQDVIVIEESFRVDVATPSVSPAIGEEASEASIKSEVTYQMAAVDESDLEKIIDRNVTQQLEGLPGQRIYKHGVDDVRISQLNIENGNYSFVVETTAYAGPQIDEKQLATQLTDKVEGEIQEVVKSRDGVQNVEVNFSPFWVNRVSSEDKITIRFDIENAE